MKRTTRAWDFAAFARILGLAFILAGLPSGAFAQTPAPTPAAAEAALPAKLMALDAATARDLDAIDAALKTIDTPLMERDVSDTTLGELRDRASPLTLRVQTDVDRLTTRLSAVKARLDQLGPPPDAKAPREAPQISQERQQQQAEYETVDALLKRAKLLLVQVQQTSAHIAWRQHAKFTHSLFERNASILAPNLWINFFAETPHNFGLARQKIGDWIGSVDSKLTTGPAIVFWTAIVALLIFYRPLALLTRRFLLHQSDEAQPSRLRKIIVAWWVTLIIAGFPLLGLMTITGLLYLFGLYDPTRQAVLFEFARAIAYVSIAAGLGAGLLAPIHPNWRLVTLQDRSCTLALRGMVAVACLLAASHLITCLGQAIGADSTYQAALRGLAALLVALVIILALWRAGQPDNCDTADMFGPRITAGKRDLFGILRFVLWIAAVAIFVSLAVGYLRLAAFLAEQIYWIGGVFFVAMMTSTMTEELISAGCKPAAPFGLALSASLGLQAASIEQIAILLIGIASVTIFMAAVLAVLAPWGVQSSDLPSYLHAALFGFRIGDITISVSAIVFALAIFGAGVMATHAVERWLDVKFLPHTHLDRGLANAIRTSIGYIGFILALGFALAYMGLNFEKLAIVAGALSVGIGFGLQSIVNNFVSGLIILWERTIRVGDWIVVGADEGVVSRINVRATEIATFDRAAVIIPNANLVAGVVKNFVRTDRVGRIVITIPVNAAANPETARDVLLEIASANKRVLHDPTPQVIFSSITSSAFNFDLYCFIEDIGSLSAVKSELNFEIYRRFKAASLFAAPPPESIVRLAGFEGLGSILNKGPNGLGSAAESG
jgi:potassium efflux system protein